MSASGKPRKITHPVKAVQHGAADAAEAATVVSEKIRGFVSKTVYGAFYGVSYGIVYGALWIANKAIPAGSPMEKGIVDGAHAACADVNRPARKAADWQAAGGLAA
jgi:hypothetical protein